MKTRTLIATLFAEAAAVALDFLSRTECPVTLGNRLMLAARLGKSLANEIAARL